MSRFPLLRNAWLGVLWLALASAPLHAAEPRWIMVSSAHFWTFTDAGDKRGREAALRLEQMRSTFSELLLKTRVNVPVPVEIFALAASGEYAQTVPPRSGSNEPGVFLAGPDRNYVVLNLAADAPWNAVAHDFAATLLSFNYPPTQPWFDEGFADYFASIRLDDKQVRLGDPNKSFTDLLNSQPWTPIADLFATGASQQTPLFRAESWIVMHYLLGKNKLTETGNYFDLVQNRSVPVAQAIEQAYGVSAAQFEQAVKDHLHELGAAPSSAQSANPPGITVIPTPVPAESFPATTTTTPLLDAEAAAMLAEIRLRIPERRAQAVQELQGMVKEAAASQVSTDNAVIHRALAWAEIEDKDYSSAMEELSAAMELDPKDEWVRYYLALVKYRVGESSGTYPGLPNMMQDMRIVLDWYPEFAEGYNMLGMARMQGGGANSAMEAIRAAMRLSPRNQTYVLNMARTYMAAKKWEAATELLLRLINNPDPQIAASAKRNLEDIPYLKKYGILPVHPEDAKPTQASKPVTETARPTASQRVAAAKAAATAAPDSDEDEEKPQAPALDKRPIKFLKGKIMTVDCSQTPVAIVTLGAGAHTLRLRTEDYKALLLIGMDQFSCDWKGLPVQVNYKAGGKTDGDLVSIEVQ